MGGSDAKKIREQLDEETIALNNYFFSENGLVAMKGNELIAKSVLFHQFRVSKIIWERIGLRSLSTIACTILQTWTFP